MLTMDKKQLAKNLFVLWMSVTAFVCAILSMHISRNMLKPKDS